jgi:hypothetical protein
MRFTELEIIYMNSDDPRNHFSGPGWFVHVIHYDIFYGPFVTEAEARKKLNSILESH